LLIHDGLAAGLLIYDGLATGLLIRHGLLTAVVTLAMAVAVSGAAPFVHGDGVEDEEDELDYAVWRMRLVAIDAMGGACGQTYAPRRVKTAAAMNLPTLSVLKMPEMTQKQIPATLTSAHERTRSRPTWAPVWMPLRLMQSVMNSTEFHRIARMIWGASALYVAQVVLM
jgi:hypothetical protein